MKKNEIKVKVWNNAITHIRYCWGMTREQLEELALSLPAAPEEPDPLAVKRLINAKEITELLCRRKEGTTTEVVFECLNPNDEKATCTMDHKIKIYGRSSKGKGCKDYSDAVQHLCSCWGMTGQQIHDLALARKPQLDPVITEEHLKLWKEYKEEIPLSLPTDADYLPPSICIVFEQLVLGMASTAKESYIGSGKGKKQVRIGTLLIKCRHCGSECSHVPSQFNSTDGHNVWTIFRSHLTKRCPEIDQQKQDAIAAALEKDKKDKNLQTTDYHDIKIYFYGRLHSRGLEEVDSNTPSAYMKYTDFFFEEYLPNKNFLFEPIRYTAFKFIKDIKVMFNNLVTSEEGAHLKKEKFIADYIQTEFPNHGQKTINVDDYFRFGKWDTTQFHGLLLDVAELLCITWFQVPGT